MKIKTTLAIGAILLFSSLLVLAVDAQWTTPITVTPASLSTGVTANVTANFRIFDGAIENLHVIGGVVGGATFYDKTFAHLGNHVITVATFNWTPSTSGTYTLYFQIDPSATSADTNASNNRVELVVTVTGGTGQPNLKPVVSYSPAHPAAGDTVKFDVLVKNIGTALAPASKMAVFENAVEVETFDIDNLPIGGSQLCTYLWTMVCGKKIRFEVDTLGVVAESNEGDNSWEVILGCFDTTPERTSRLIQADLYPQLKIDPYPEVGGNIGVTLKVINVGEADAPISIGAIQFGSDTPLTEPMTLLKYGQSDQITKTKQVTNEKYFMISGFADFNNTIKESDETNNRASQKVIVRGPDLKFTNARVSNTKVKLQEKVKIWGTVMNAGTTKAGPFEIQANFEPCKGIAQGYKIKHVPGLAAGASVDFEFSHRFACLRKKVNYVMIDKNNAVKELSELNNTTLRIVVDVTSTRSYALEDFTNYVDTSHD